MFSDDALRRSAEVALVAREDLRSQMFENVLNGVSHFDLVASMHNGQVTAALSAFHAFALSARFEQLETVFVDSISIIRRWWRSEKEDVGHALLQNCNVVYAVTRWLSQTEA